MPRTGPVPYTRVIPISESSEGGRAVRDRNAVVASRSRYEVILVSPAARCPLRGRYRRPVTND
ncbi:hypothetical protein ADL00_17595 [Streptomyces sp. AS58]|uniref:Uncharacterized protein n=1 Tax=Streptomyces cadmiisoli TaxID=2184053 RepID=A0A2Z4IVE1_9ACTN|nr:hypothetical protein DN051_09125 [Streptomyces cadmiisoli]KOV66611.1 hypothetical protein ADL00_17595 [Streptomyces sp. AS58]